MPRTAVDVTAMHVDRGGSAEHVRGLAAAFGDDPHIVRIASPGARPPSHPRRMRDRLATLQRDLRWSLRDVERAARAAGAEVLHVPVPIGPSWGTLPLVVTVHDLFVLSEPRRFRRWHRHYSAATIPPLVRRARRVIAVSSHTREALLDRFGLEPSRVQVVPNGVRDDFAPLTADDPRRAALRARFGLPARYVASLGQVEPRKNLERLAAAARHVAQRPGCRDLVVVHAGPMGWGASVEAVPAAAAASAGAFRLVGTLSPEDLAVFVAGAEMLAYPSLGEGFGLPVAEAMACGIAVLTSHAGALAETAGRDAEIVEPTSVEAIAASLERLWTDAAHRAHVAACGLARAARWRWPAVAEATRQVYALAADDA
ncbi:MAG: glycosyltransferase family 4 protein [Gemmatimonadaceae bacterium]|nr:glycosyltransferase family 4 protein [Gemmatimonadaceae bacterium]